MIGEEPPVVELGRPRRRQKIGSQCWRSSTAGTSPVVEPVERAGRERKDVVEVAQRAERREVRGRRIHGELAGRDDLVELRAEDRHAHAAAAELPVDVERLGVPRVAPVRQHVPPPGVLGRLRDPHVVRDDVDEDAEAGRARRLREPLEPLGPAARRIDLRGVDHVVAVVGAGRRAQQRGEIGPVDPEIVEVAGDGGRGIQVESRPDLQAVGRQRAHGYFRTSGRGAWPGMSSLIDVSAAASDAATE